jgi:Flp pilus assembly protein TadG
MTKEDQMSFQHQPKRSRRPGCDRGAAAVEFVLVLPLLILLVFGILEFGRGYNAKITLTHAAREAVREYTINDVEADAITVGLDAAPQLAGVTITITDTCSNTPGDVGEVTATWDFDYTIPLFRTGTSTLEERAVMRCGA